MSRFSSLLNDINDRLKLPPQAKARIILEIAADLEDAYEFFCEQGLSEAEATARAQEKFILDEDTIAELSIIHQPLVKKWLDKVSVYTENRWERAALILTLLVLAVLSGQSLAKVHFFENAGIFVWPIIGVAVAGIVQFFIKFQTFFSRKSFEPHTLRKGIDAIAYLGAFSIALGFTGYFYELFRTGVDTVFPGGSLITVICTVLESQQQLTDIYTCFVTSATVMTASLLTALFLALLWFVLNNKATAMEMKKAASLLAK